MTDDTGVSMSENQARDQFVRWLTAHLAAEQIKSIAFKPFLAFFYPDLANPTRFSSLARQTILIPRTATEVAEIIAAADSVGQAVFVRQGSGLLSLDTPLPFPPGAFILDLRRLNDVQINVEAGWVEVGPAVTLAETNRLLEPLGFRFPLIVGDIQWGGLISINMSGHLIDAYAGKPGDFVLGLSVVLPDGTTLETGTSAQRKIVGPDLTRLFIGGQALFGVLTRIRLRLMPAPAASTNAWITFENLADTADLVTAMYHRGLSYPSVLELVQEAFATASGMGKYVPRGHLLLVTMEGESQALAQAKMDRFIDLARECGAVTSQVVGDNEAWQAVWDIRESPFHNLKPEEYLLGEAFDVPLDRMREGLECAADLVASALLAEFPGLRGYLVAHIGAGTVHPIYACPPEWDFDKRVSVIQEIRTRTQAIKLALGATVGEQGIFPQHAAWFEQNYGSQTIAILRGMKRVLDPRDTLNPGRLELPSQSKP
jgi:D-lactate dehydrogenase (cytochrome)